MIEDSKIPKGLPEQYGAFCELFGNKYDPECWDKLVKSHPDLNQIVKVLATLPGNKTDDGNKTEPVDYSKPVKDMVEEQGFKFEQHEYTTEDGYINTLHRVVKPGTIYFTKTVFLQHGLLGSSADFVIGTKKNSLGYYLADLGYDVWLGNARGNLYSRGHEEMDPATDHEYWKFSWDQMGKYDLPAAFDKVRNVTYADKLTYIGHSMGTTMFWVSLQENPGMEDQVEQMIGLGPVAKVNHMKSPLKHLAPWINQIEYLFKFLGIDQFVPTNHIIQQFMKATCDKTMTELKMCDNLLFLITGFDSQQANLTLLPYVLGHTPAGASTQTVLHYAQLVNSGRFCKYDYGSKENIKRYGQSKPPEYDLSKVKTPVTLMWGQNDWLADPRDVKYLAKKLPQLKQSYMVPFKNWNHVDFLWALEADKYIFKPIVDLL